MIHLSFSTTDLEELRSQRFQHPHPHVQRKMEALLLKSYSLPHSQIAEILGLCLNTLRTYFQDYQKGGVLKLKEIHFHSPQSKLQSVRGTLESSFQKNPPPTLKEAAAHIEQLTGIKRGTSQVRVFLQFIGMKRRKTGSLPSKADSEKQRIFKEQQLEPKLHEAREEKRKVFFVDAAHFVFAPFLGFLWCFTRLFVKAPCGRKRFNVLGALDAVTHEITMFTNDTYINALSVCDLLTQIAQQNIGLPITLVLDNARYQKCAIVQQMASSLNIELLYLPTYSPNLNLIERFWKLTKKECLASKYYPDFLSFRSAIATFIHSAPIQHKAKLDSLLTHHFQDFSKIQDHLLAA